MLTKTYSRKPHPDGVDIEIFLQVKALVKDFSLLERLRKRLNVPKKYLPAKQTLIDLWVKK